VLSSFPSWGQPRANVCHLRSSTHTHSLSHLHTLNRLFSKVDGRHCVLPFPLSTSFTAAIDYSQLKFPQVANQGCEL
jgi:hypothetical protein